MKVGAGRGRMKSSLRRSGTRFGSGNGRADQAITNPVVPTGERAWFGGAGRCGREGQATRMKHRRPARHRMAASGMMVIMIRIRAGLGFGGVGRIRLAGAVMVSGTFTGRFRGGIMTMGIELMRHPQQTRPRSARHHDEGEQQMAHKHRQGCGSGLHRSKRVQKPESFQYIRFSA